MFLHSSFTFHTGQHVVLAVSGFEFRHFSGFPLGVLFSRLPRFLAFLFTSRLGFGRIFPYYSFPLSPPVPSLFIVLYLLLSCLQPVGSFYCRASVWSFSCI